MIDVDAFFKQALCQEAKQQQVGQQASDTKSSAGKTTCAGSPTISPQEDAQDVPSGIPSASTSITSTQGQNDSSQPGACEAGEALSEKSPSASSFVPTVTEKNILGDSGPTEKAESQQAEQPSPNNLGEPDNRPGEDPALPTNFPTPAPVLAEPQSRTTGSRQIESEKRRIDIAESGEARESNESTWVESKDSRPQDSRDGVRESLLPEHAPKMAGNGEQGEPATGLSVVPHETSDLASSQETASQASVSVVQGLTAPDDEDEFSKVCPKETPLGKTLDQIVEYLNRYTCFANEEQAVACALWAAHTHVFEEFQYTPYLHIFAPEPRCGKTNLMESIGFVSARQIKIGQSSDSAFFREVDEKRPTLLWDEVDNLFRDNDRTSTLLGMLNIGFKAGAQVMRNKNFGRQREYFNVFCPKIMTGIGKIPAALRSRCIDLKLVRQTKQEKAKVEKYRERYAAALAEPMRVQLEAWAKTAKDIGAAHVEYPPEIEEGRIEDIIEPLDKARTAMVLLFRNHEDQSTGEQLLHDCRVIFTNLNAPSLFSETLVEKLVEVENANSPWPVWWESDVRFGKLGSPKKKLAYMLDDYGIKPKLVRIGNDVRRGYLKADFIDAWSRYLPEAREGNNG
jgi:hypothetical protein